MTGPRGQEPTPTPAPLPEANGGADVRNPTGPETPESEPAPPPSALPDDIIRAISHYRPQVCSHEEFGLIAEALQQALIAYAPPNATSGVNGPGAHLAKFMVWIVNRPGRIDSQSTLEVLELAEHGLVDSYLATGMEGVPKDTRATARSVLRRAVQRLTEQPRETLSHSTIQPPYTDDQVREIRDFALGYPKPTVRRGLCAIVGLGLGAGLDSRDQRSVTPLSIRELPAANGRTAMTVDVLGNRPRSVPVRPEFVELIRAALAIHAEQGKPADHPLYGAKPNRKNVTGHVLSAAGTQDGSPKIDVSRLRSTWLLAMMNLPMSLADLLHIAGLQSARSVADLLPYCPAVDMDVVTSVVLSTSGQ